MTLRMERYGQSRYWAIYDGPELVVVTLYKRGAQEVLRRLAAQPPAATETAAQAAAVEAAAQQAQALAAQVGALARQAQAAAQAVRARVQSSGEAGAAGGRPPLPAQGCRATATSGSATRRRPSPLVTSFGARSRAAKTRHRRAPPRPATRGSSTPRACLGPQAAGAAWQPVSAGPRGAACTGGLGAAPPRGMRKGSPCIQSGRNGGAGTASYVCYPGSSTRA
jgi:hypothetical protein